MKRSYYSEKSEIFAKTSPSEILGQLTLSHQFALEDLQRDAWLEQIKILQSGLSSLSDSHIFFEYEIPRMGKRVDVIIIHNGVIFCIEFKVGEKAYPQHALDQCVDYALDLKNFHSESHNKRILPVLFSTQAPEVPIDFVEYDDLVMKPIKVNQKNWLKVLLEASSYIKEQDYICTISWENATYKPTPTIIEAAQHLYKNHSVKNITHSGSTKVNLKETSDLINTAIDHSKKHKKKSICFVTGVPGAGKTLAGLNIANERHNVDESEHAVFLSGNGPLVEVLQEALARDESKSSDISKKDASRKTKSFIQNIHHFRDDNLRDLSPPIEKITIFDEAQRAWNLEQTSSFMKRKKGVSDFNHSEPEFLISVLDRHEDWSVVICLIGGGQEINTGEAGLSEWFNSLSNHYTHWDVYLSDELKSLEYCQADDLEMLKSSNKCTFAKDLHLSVSIRSFKATKLSDFVKNLILLDLHKSQELFKELISTYPICFTRNISCAKSWLNTKARGNERTGIITSSGAARLKPYGLNVKAKIDCVHWFLNDKSDVRSSNYLEDVATQFDIQGLEIDWACVGWDADLRLVNGEWTYKKFVGTKWQQVNKPEAQQYLENAYRVLLTRARQGLVIFIPPGDKSDPTRLPEFYNGLADFFKEVGLKEI